MRHDAATSVVETTGIGWLDATRLWLARFPLSIIQLAGRIGVGATFFKAGLLKYQSWEFTVRLFQEEYRVPLLDPAVAARIAMVQELTIPILLFLGLATRIATLPAPRNDRRHPDVRVSQCIQRASGLGRDSRAAAHARPRSVLARLPDQSVRPEKGPPTAIE